MKRLMILAGEESGVLYARQIADAVRRRFHCVEIRGYGEYGFKTEELAVFGIFAVLRNILFFMRVKRTMIGAIDAWRPDAVCTVDYPGMNLRLAAYAKSRGIRTVHVVCPQVWAWHRGRIPKIESSLDRLCCFFPFEPGIFRSGFATFVGHPLVRELERFGRSERREHSVAVLPGSRLGEVEKILPILLLAIRELVSRHPETRFVIPAASERLRAVEEELCRAAGVASLVEIVTGGARTVLATATCAVVASGTATLEAALLGCPTLLVYRVGAVTAFIARRVIRGICHVGLANIIAEKAGVECPMPELLQEDFTVSRVVCRLEEWLTDESAREEARRKLAETMALLSGEGMPIDRIADELEDVK